MFRRKLAFLIAAAIAAAGEGAIFYKQWPAPGLKVCASVELGELLAAAARTEADLREARARLQAVPTDEASKEVMRLETVSADASTAVAKYKQQAKQQQAGGGACS